MKRLFSLLLALALILTLSSTAFAAEDTGFSDIPAGSWYGDAVTYVQSNDIMSGVTDTAFHPEGTMTRAMLAAVLYRASGSPAVTGTDDFTDTSAEAWYADAVVWASRQGLVSGYGNGLFGTNDPVSREQIASIFWRYAGQPEATGTAAPFADESRISSYALHAVHWARSSGIISGKDGNLFDPQTSATRAQVASILHSYLTAETPDTPETPEVPAQESKALVVYFSMPETSDSNDMTTEEDNSVVVVDGEVLGNTQYMAYVIQESTGADIFRIEPSSPYPTDHSTLVDLAQAEQDANARPAIKDQIEDFSTYDTVFIGYPIWWSDMPMILHTFFDEYDFSGKTVIPFSTHGGSGFSGTPRAIAELEPNAQMLDGLTISRNQIQDARDEIITWINSLNI